MLEELDENEEQEVDWVSGAYMFVRRDVLDNGHVFDEDIYMWFEDTLLCYNLRKAGYRVVYLPYAPIVHYKGKSAGKIPVKAAFNSFRGSTIYFQKVYGRPLARFYATTVRLIWALFALCFSILEFVPNEKIKKKAQLFRRLIAMGSAI
jgi:GT2 family glycosyltransferase